ncbi:hypothetical protein [Anaerorhabdus sp.]|uniref:hypothetical protein n=1 Tax=Anaerorhabdus sp. TaxID=1872524 RepID=UPI002FCC2174
MDPFLDMTDPIEKDTYIQMKCSVCGYVEGMPSWCFDEVCEMMEFDDNDDIPHIVCPRCNAESLYPMNSSKFK